MPLGVPVFLVRHGHDRHDTGELTPRGVGDAEGARDELLARGVGQNALVLSSKALRAIQSAQIIAAGLGCRFVEGSTQFTRYGSAPGGLDSLDHLLTNELADNNCQIDGTGALIVVTHAPLIAAARDLDPLTNLDNEVPYGSVTQYEPGSWIEPTPSN